MMGATATIDLALKYFVNRPDVCASASRWGRGSPSPVYAHRGGHSIEDYLEAHVLGRHISAGHKAGGGTIIQPVRRIGFYTQNTQGLCKWACIDFDGPSHNDPKTGKQRGKENVLEEAEAVLFRAFLAEVPAYLERSSGGDGWHVWIFFEEPVEPRLARELAKALLEMDPEQALPDHIQIFPTVHKTAIETGYMVWAPWWHGADPGCTQFYEPAGERLRLVEPVSFDTLSDIRGALARIRPEGWAPKLVVQPTVEVSKHARREGASRVLRGSELWASWKRQAIQCLPLDAVYHLTGRRRPGWLEARDSSRSKTGDRNPSANVSEGHPNLPRGMWYSFLRPEEGTLDVFDYLERVRGMSKPQARKFVAEISGVPLPEVSPSWQTGPAGMAERWGWEDGPMTSVQSGAYGQGLRLLQGGDDPRDRGFKLPTIETSNRQVSELVNETWSAVLSQPQLGLLNYFGAISRVRPAGEVGGVTVGRVTRDEMLGAIVEAANWIRININKDGEPKIVASSPRREIPGIMLAKIDARLPTLKGVSRCPFFDADGRLVDRPGYDPESGIFVDTQIEPVRPRNVEAAIALIEQEMLIDFPWEEPSDLTHMWALLLLPFVRRMFRGFTPLHLIDAPMAGSGKGKIVNCAALIGTGRMIEVQSMPRSGDESRKRVTSLLAEGESMVFFDNQAEGKQVDSAELAAVLTADVWTDRRLSQNAMIKAPNEAIWGITGNNVTMTKELARRSLRIRINPGMRDPHRRGSFRHKDLENWVHRMRPELTGALIECVDYWIRQGAPRRTELKSKGSFEAWRELMGGLLETLDRPQFLDSDAQLEGDSNTQAEDDWAHFIKSWLKEFGTGTVTSFRLWQFVSQYDLLAGMLADFYGPDQRKRALSERLLQVKGQVFEGHRIVRRRDTSQRCEEFRLEPVTP